MEAEHKMKGFGSISFLITIGILFIVGGGLVLSVRYGIFSSRHAIRSEGSSHSSAQDFEKNTEKTAVDISNWKTYRNEKYGFELKYPPEITLGDAKKLYYGGNTNGVVALLFPKREELRRQYSEATTSLYIDGIVLDISSADEDTCYYIGGHVPLFGDRYQHPKKITIGSLDFDKVQSSDCGAGSCHIMEQYSVIKDHQCYRVDFAYTNLNDWTIFAGIGGSREGVQAANEKELQKVDLVLQQMLSSFKFLSDKLRDSHIDTSTWKTYRNEEYGFEVSYPTEARTTVKINAFEFKQPNGKEDNIEFLFKGRLGTLGEGTYGVRKVVISQTAIENDSSPTLEELLKFLEKRGGYSEWRVQGGEEDKGEYPIYVFKYDTKKVAYFRAAGTVFSMEWDSEYGDKDDFMIKTFDDMLLTLIRTKRS